VPHALAGANRHRRGCGFARRRRRCVVTVVETAAAAAAADEAEKSTLRDTFRRNDWLRLTANSDQPPRPVAGQTPPAPPPPRLTFSAAARSSVTRGRPAAVAVTYIRYTTTICRPRDNDIVLYRNTLQYQRFNRALFGGVGGAGHVAVVRVRVVDDRDDGLARPASRGY